MFDEKPTHFLMEDLLSNIDLKLHNILDVVLQYRVCTLPSLAIYTILETQLHFAIS
jgi:hypothetical protein